MCSRCYSCSDACYCTATRFTFGWNVEHLFGWTWLTHFIKFEVGKVIWTLCCTKSTDHRKVICLPIFYRVHFGGRVLKFFNLLPLLKDVKTSLANHRPVETRFISYHAVVVHTKILRNVHLCNVVSITNRILNSKRTPTCLRIRDNEREFVCNANSTSPWQFCRISYVR